MAARVRHVFGGSEVKKTRFNSRWSFKWQTDPLRFGLGLWWTPCSCGSPCFVLQIGFFEVAVHIFTVEPHNERPAA
jgi:hypothetical protein